MTTIHTDALRSYRNQQYNELCAIPQKNGGYEIVVMKPWSISFLIPCLESLRWRFSSSLNGHKVALLIKEHLEKKAANRKKWEQITSQVMRLTRGMAEMRRNNITGKVLDEKHWSEALIPSHPGPTLRNFLYTTWNRSKSSESFVDWCASAAGQEIFESAKERFAGHIQYASSTKIIHSESQREITLADLDKMSVRYLSSEEKQAYRVDIKKDHAGRAYFSQDNQPFSTAKHCSHGTKGKAIFVVDPLGQFYSGTQIMNFFHHSSFLAGAAVIGAGELLIDEQGNLIEISNNSGHYEPGPEEMVNILKLLRGNGIDLTKVTLKLVDHPFKGHYKTFNAAAFLDSRT